MDAFNCPLAQILMKTFVGEEQGKSFVRCLIGDPVECVRKLWVFIWVLILIRGQWLIWICLGEEVFLQPFSAPLHMSYIAFSGLLCSEVSFLARFLQLADSLE